MATYPVTPFGQNNEVPKGLAVVDNLTTQSPRAALSANMGYRLNGLIEQAKSEMAQPSKIPSVLKVGEKTKVIYTIDDFLMAHDYNDEQELDNLMFSNDLGKTWVTVENTFGIITNAFMFADGTFMMGCKKDDGCRIYWTRDFETFTQATVLDYDGNPYSLEAGKTRFYILKPKSYHTYVNGVEHYCFWDYIISTTTNPRMWYAISDENGVTVRAAFAFGLSTLNGSTVPARHGHAFDYNPYDEYFYALTGDSVSECHVMKGRYTNNNGVHTWTWEKLATGGGYKLTSISYDEGNLYGITDYTEASLAASKGVVSIPIDKIGLTETNSSGVVCPAKLRYWFHATKDFMKQGSYYPNPTDAQIAAMSGIVVDNHGWRFIGTDYQGSSKHMIAKGGHNFVWVDNDKNLKFGSFIGPNNNGDVYVSGGVLTNPNSSVSGEAWLRISRRGLYNLTEIMRNSGATDFFEGWKGTLY